MGDCSKIVADIELRMISGGLASADSIVGCTEDEITALAKQYCIRLPVTYRAFLARMGHGAGEQPKEVSASFSCWLRDTVEEDIH
jgi:hypothetical protein